MSLIVFDYVIIIGRKSLMAKSTSNHSHHRRLDEFMLGLKHEAPMLVGVIPFGLIFGALGVEAGLTPLQIMLRSVIIFGGVSQIIFLDLVATGVNPYLISSTVGVINLRHALYSARIAPFFSQLSLGWKIILSYLLTDEAYAMTIRRFETQPHHPFMHYHMLGTGLCLWISWQITTVLGILLGAAIPPSLGLGFAIALTFMTIIIPYCTQFPHLIAVLVSASIAIFAYALPWKLNLIIAAIAGMLAGYLTESLTKSVAKNKGEA